MFKRNLHFLKFQKVKLYNYYFTCKQKKCNQVG